jgi:plastocyanin
MKKALIVLAVLILLAGGAYFLKYNAKQVQAPPVPNPQNNPAPQDQSVSNDADFQAKQATTSPQPQKNSQPAKQVTGTYSSGDESVAPDIQVWETDYNGNNFSPDTINIKLGDIVFFKNKSAGNFWPLAKSADYPEFDAGKAVVAAGKFQFQFTKVGKWEFYDKLNPSAAGVVNVSK